MRKPITIAGGGLAGLTLGILLRQRGVPVTIWEAGHYPRHRVCGEFVSGRGHGVLERAGMVERLKQEGALPAKTAAFFTRHSSSSVLPLPEQALTISRFKLDRLLADEFRELGGELREGERWCGGFGEGIIRGTGRQARTQVNGWRWIGLKAHACGVSLTADLEMHVMHDGYVGLCRLGDGEVNVCGLFRSRMPMVELREKWKERLAGPPGSPLRARLGEAEFDESSFCSVAGLPAGVQAIGQADECRIGDSIAMIPPVTGNGMSIAFESAGMAAGLIGRYSDGESAWPQVVQSVNESQAAAFTRRLRWATLTQSALFCWLTRAGLIGLAGRWPQLWRWLFARTR